MHVPTHTLARSQITRIDREIYKMAFTSKKIIESQTDYVAKDIWNTQTLTENQSANNKYEMLVCALASVSRMTRRRVCLA